MFDPQHDLTIDAPIIGRILPRLPDLLDALFEAGLAAVPGTEALPQGHFHDELMPTIVQMTAAVLRSIEEQRSLTAEEFDDVVGATVRQLAEDRIPLKLLIRSVYGWSVRLWQEARTAAEPEDLPDLFAFSDRLLEIATLLTMAMAEAHTEVERSIYGTEREARRALCAALLKGADTTELAARADITVAETYDVLALRIGRFDKTVPLAVNAVTRKRVRLVQQALDTLAGTTALNTFDGNSGVALLPALAPSAQHAPYANLAADLAAKVGADVIVIDAGTVPSADLTAAAAEASEIGGLAQALSRPTGTYLLDDFMLEYQLTRPGRSRDRLAQRIIPLVAHPHLIDALEAHIKHGSDRKAAAAEVHLHPNSFSYRLRRIGELTGFDPSDPGESRLLAAALTVYRLYPPQTVSENDAPS